MQKAGLWTLFGFEGLAGVGMRREIVVDKCHFVFIFTILLLLAKNNPPLLNDCSNITLGTVWLMNECFAKGPSLVNAPHPWGSSSLAGQPTRFLLPVIS